jgi:antitoxin (DNA-binding transcriptional repressor) of toxin-antitoxin stability system
MLQENRGDDRMETMTVAELKARFSDALEMVRKGKDIVISFGKKKEKIAVLAPYSRLYKKTGRKLGLLAGKASFAVKGDFKITDEELLSR